MIDPELLFSDYEFYRAHTANAQKYPIRRLKRTPERIAALRHMDLWCEENGFNTRYWLYTLFHVRSWLFAPKWEQLWSPKHVKKYLTIQDAPLYRERMALERAVQNRRSNFVFDPNRDISASVESLKRRYVDTGAAVACRKSAQTETFGYHPQSSVCTRCPERVKCAEELNQSVAFDIQALRRGELSADVARETAIRARG